MDFRYQIAIFGPGSGTYGSVLRKTLERDLADLGMDVATHVSFLDRASAESRDVKSPFVAVYFGGTPTPAEDAKTIDALIATSCTILPVVSDLGRYSSFVPPALKPINGLGLDAKDPDLEAAANLVLEILGLLRRKRKLFISYKRTDSEHVALQLRHALEAQGYDVFLDTHSVAKGAQFQDVLWQSMADCDVIVLLDSKKLGDSYWSKQEIARAEAMTIGLLQVIWPDHTPFDHTALCERLFLENADFEGKTLDDQKAKSIVFAVEKLRARCMAARHDNLVREFCDAAAAVKVTTAIQPERFIIATLPSGKKLAAIPTVGVPDADLYHSINRRFPDKTYAEAFLVYDHRGLRSSWSEFLAWLDDFLPVKAVKVTSSAQKLVKP